VYILFRITIDKYERNTLLTIRRATRIDSGKYTLLLKNSSGTAEKDAEVIVLGNLLYLLLLYDIYAFGFT